MLVDRISVLNGFLVIGLLGLVGCSSEEPAKFAGDMVLAISWQPGFCETRRSLPECRSQTGARADATRFSLHGLWPQPGSNVYCGTEEKYVRLDKSRQWLKLPELSLSDESRLRLEQAMPGTQSGLQRHEWIKHGTCYSADPEAYYQDSLFLLDKINGSAIGELFRSNINNWLTLNTIRTTFDQTLGIGAGDRVRMSCRRVGSRTLITELTIGLSGKITGHAELSKLILTSPPTRPGCPGGIVDPAGFQ